MYSLSELMVEIMHRRAVKEYQLTASTAQTRLFCAWLSEKNIQKFDVDTH
jgi:hypothetical protein